MNFQEKRKLYVKAGSDCFLAVVKATTEVSSLLKKLEKIHSEVFPGSKTQFLSVSQQGYLIPKNYLVGQVLENNSYVEVLQKPLQKAPQKAPKETTEHTEPKSEAQKPEPKPETHKAEPKQPKKKKRPHKASNPTKKQKTEEEKAKPKSPENSQDSDASLFEVNSEKDIKNKQNLFGAK